MKTLTRIITAGTVVMLVAGGLILSTVGVASATGTIATTTSIALAVERPIDNAAALSVGVNVTSSSGTPTGAWNYTITYSSQSSGETITCKTGNSSLDSLGEWGGTIYINSTTCALPEAITVTVYYEGNSTYAPSSSQQSILLPSPTSTTITGPSSATSGQPTTFTAAVTADGQGTPTGTVTFSSDGTTLCTESETTGSTTCTTSALLGGSQAVTADYSGSPDYSGSQATMTVQVNTPAATTTSVTTSPDPVYAGETETITVDVTSSSGTPTGSVSYTVTEPNGTVASQGTVTLNSSGEWSISDPITSSAAIGTWTVAASYTGNTTYAASSGSATLTIESPPKTPTSINMGESTNPIQAGQTETFTATVSSASGTLDDAGDVAFSDGSGDLSGCGSVALNTLGVATCTYTIPSGLVGTYDYYAEYLGNSTYAHSTGSESLTITSSKIATTTSMTASPNPVQTGETETFTATVSSASGTPTGTVVFSGPNGDLSGCSSVTLTSGTATCVYIVPSGLGGSYGYSATYSGNSTYAASGAGVGLQINPNTANTATTLTVSSNPVPAGQSVTFTASVRTASGTPTGTVAFSAGGVGNNISGCGNVSLSSGVATCVYTVPANWGGTYNYAATYSGSSSYSPSTGYLTLTIEPAPTATTTSVTTSPDPLYAGETETITVEVASSSGTPTGAVSVTTGGETMLFQGGVNLNSSGEWSLSLPITSSYAPGTYTIVADYAGNSTYATSSGSATLTIESPPKTGSTTTLNANPGIYAIPGTTVLSALVMGGSGTPTGSVTFAYGGTALCSAVPLTATSSTSATASCTTSSLPLGTDTITATYSGNTTYTSSSATTSVQVLADPATVSVLANPVHISSGASTLLTATIKDAINNLPETSGTVTFEFAGQTLCVETITNSKGTATCTITSLPVGTDTVVAGWTGISGGKTISATASTDVYVIQSSTPSPTPPVPTPPAPVVSGISPSTGPRTGGTVVTITGTNLFNAGYVFFGSVSAKFTVQVLSQFDIEITAIAPPGTGTVNITVTTPGGTSAVSSADKFTYLNPPVPVKTQSTWHAISPVRICDTRPGNRSLLTGNALSQCEGQTMGGARQNLTISVAGIEGIPVNATAAILNITASRPTADGELMVCPANSISGCIPVSTFKGGIYAIAEAKMVALNGGEVTIEYRGAGFVNVIVDVEGYETSTVVSPVSPTKPRAVWAGYPTTTPMPITVSAPAGTTAVALRITASGAKEDGYVTVYSSNSASPVPLVSAINFAGNGESVTNVVFVPVGKLYLVTNGGDPLVTITIVGNESEIQG